MKQKFKPIQYRFHSVFYFQIVVPIRYQLVDQLLTQLEFQLWDQLRFQLKEVIKNETEV